MPSVESILEQMRRAPQNVRFEDLVKVCNSKFGAGRIKGSHHIYSVPGQQIRVNLQNSHGKSKDYQVKQVLTAIEQLEG